MLLFGLLSFVLAVCILGYFAIGALAEDPPHRWLAADPQDQTREDIDAIRLRLIAGRDVDRAALRQYDPRHFSNPAAKGFVRTRKGSHEHH